MPMKTPTLCTLYPDENRCERCPADRKRQGDEHPRHTVQGNKVTAKIGGNLNIETLQEKETYEEKNTSADFDLSWDIRAGKFSKPTFGLSANQGTIDFHYRIEIRENPMQDVSALSRDTANSLNELGRIFDKQKIEEQQELAKAFGEEAFRLAHNLPDDGSGRKIAVHAIVGGIMSQIYNLTEN